MSKIYKPGWKPKPSPYSLTKEHTERLPPERLETAEQAGARAHALLASIGLVSIYPQHHRPYARSIPGFVGWRPVRARWWLVLALGARGLPQRDSWGLEAIVDAYTGEFRWWHFSHRYDYLL